MEQGYLLICLGQRYILESTFLVNTLRKNNDMRPVSLLIKETDLEYANSFNLFDNIIIYHPDYNDKTYIDCVNEFERNCVYFRINFDKFIPYDETICLDSDVLCQYSTDNLWDFLSKESFPVRNLGKKKADSHWHWGQADIISNMVGKKIPAIHCGFNYVRKGLVTDDFFDRARDIFLNYDYFGLKRYFRGGRTEEGVFSLAYSETNADPIEYTGFPIMTFNYTKDEPIPSKIQILLDDNNARYEMEDYIPFIHMFEKMEGENFKIIYDRIMGQ